jgi:hypothetical protein
MILRILILLFILGNLLSCVAKAAPVPVADLFAAAIKHGGYEKACAEREDKCPAPGVLIHEVGEGNAGQFEWDMPTVVQVATDGRSAPGSANFNDTVVHEMVHYLQWLTGKLGPHRQDVCEMHLELETEAYEAGHKYSIGSGAGALDPKAVHLMLQTQYNRCKRGNSPGSYAPPGN